jgi:hypothetical protein
VLILLFLFFSTDEGLCVRAVSFVAHTVSTSKLIPFSTRARHWSKIFCLPPPKKGSGFIRTTPKILEQWRALVVIDTL